MTTTPALDRPQDVLRTPASYEEYLARAGETRFTEWADPLPSYRDALTAIFRSNDAFPPGLLAL